MDQTKWDLRFLKLAREISTWSKDPSTRVGAVLVRGNIRIADGYNGFPTAMPDSPELYADRTEKYSRIIHAEMNAILFAKGDTQETTLYTYPFCPCDRCTVIAIQAGVTRFVFPVPTREAEVRWGAAFNAAKHYMEECRRGWKEYNLSTFEEWA